MAASNSSSRTHEEFLSPGLRRGRRWRRYKRRGVGRFPLPNWGGAGELLAPFQEKCKSHAEKVKFDAYFASYEVAYKVNEHRL